MDRNRLIPLLFLLFLLTPHSAVASEDDDASIIARFQEYLRINTSHPSPDYASSTRFLLAQSSSLGLPAETLEFSPGKPLVLLSWPGRSPSLPSLLLNSHTDVVPAEPRKWAHHPFSASADPRGNIFARGAQDMKCVGLQYIEAVRSLKSKGFAPDRTVHISFVPDEEIGGHDGAEAFVKSKKFRGLNVGVVMDEGLASPGEEYRVFYGERRPWWMVIKARGAPGHGARMYEGSAMENLGKSLEVIRRFRASQLDLVKAGRKAEGEVVSVNMVFLKAGTPSSTSQTVLFVGKLMLGTLCSWDMFCFILLMCWTYLGITCIPPFCHICEEIFFGWRKGYFDHFDLFISVLISAYKYISLGGILVTLIFLA